MSGVKICTTPLALFQQGARAAARHGYGIEVQLMKLAEALALRADTKKRIEQLKERLKLSVLVQEGEAPPEDPQELIAELERLLGQMTDLVRRINRTNLQTILPQTGEESAPLSLTDALAERDTLTLYHQVLLAVADTASPRLDRATRTEIRRVATVSVAALRRQLDEIARRRRELDTCVQAANWTTELVE